MYARNPLGYSVSDIVCGKKTMFRCTVFKCAYNHGLLLREIWMEALSACGYDAEEVISTATRIEELPEKDDESTSARSEEWHPISPTFLMDEGWGTESHYQDGDVVGSAELL